MDPLIQLSAGGLFGLLCLREVLRFLKEREAVRNGKSGGDDWQTVIADATLKASEQAVRTLVLPVLKAVVTSCNMTQEAVVEISKTLAVLQALEQRKHDDDVTKQAAAEAGSAAAAKVMAAGKHTA